jgi:hypothetical protein
MTPLLVFVGAWFALFDTTNLVSQSVVFGVGVVYIAILATVFSALGAIFLAAVYRYATTGNASGAFEFEVVSTALRTNEAVSK